MVSAERETGKVGSPSLSWVCSHLRGFLGFGGHIWGSIWVLRGSALAGVRLVELGLLESLCPLANDGLMSPLAGLQHRSPAAPFPREES